MNLKQLNSILFEKPPEILCYDDSLLDFFAEKEKLNISKTNLNSKFFLTKCEFTITQLKAPVIIEELKTPPQPVDVEPQTLLGDKKPLLDSLKQIGGKIPGAGDVVGSIVDRLEGEIKKAIKPILDSGAKLKGLDLGKASGGLQSSGYTFVGEDPDSKLSFDVEGESGQRRSTTVKLFREDIERLL